MKIRTFDLRMYEYEEFVTLAKNYILNKVSHDGQGWFFFNILELITKETFLDWIKLGLVITFVIDGEVPKRIPLEKRHYYTESDDAAFVVYWP